LQQIEQVRNVSSNVLIVGESGTGKELVARAIHSTSDRKTHRFAAINCGAIPENLLESELFGHKRGSFTDAKSNRIGIFEACNQGTLLLDEIGEMPIDLQVKLLRVLQEKEITPLGSSKSVKVNTRVLAATNRNLLADIKSGRFREDLYYRLSVITIENPPLNTRKSDIPILVEHFLRKMNSVFNKAIRPPTQDLEARLMTYSWPGNIRELQNCIERGVILSTDGELHLENMFQSLEHKAETNSLNGNLSREIFHQSLSAAKKDFEKEYLKQLLEITRGNISEMASMSSRYRADIYRLLTKHGLEWEGSKQS
jgi:two-component system response regulator GlrR